MKNTISRTWCRVVLVRIDVSEESIASILTVTRIGELRKTLEISSNRSKLRSVLTRPTRHHILEDVILHSHGRENLKSYNCDICMLQEPQ
jgi:hypothetical protein